MTAATMTYDDRRPVRRRLTPQQYVEEFGPPRQPCTGCDHGRPSDHDAGGRLDRRVLAELAAVANWGGRADRPWGEDACESVPHIAEAIGYSERSVQYALRRLERGGFVERLDRPGTSAWYRIVRTVEPIGSVDNEPEPVDTPVDALAPAAAEIGPVAPKGATVAPNLGTPTKTNPPYPPDRGRESNADAAAAAAHAPPGAARGQPSTDHDDPPAPAGHRAEPHRRDAEAGRAAGPLRDVGSGADVAVDDLGDQVEGDPPVDRASRVWTRELRRCPRCGAGPGQRCTNRQGRPRAANHSDRRAPRPRPPARAYRPPPRQ